MELFKDGLLSAMTGGVMRGVPGPRKSDVVYSPF